MISTQINPAWLDADDYIAFLNRGFADQWTRSTYEWYLRRSFNGKAPDLGVRCEGRRILAGVTYGYRQIKIGTMDAIDVCVMSAGTTLLDERRKGHYHALLEAGLELGRRKSCAALLGFVTRENGSGRGLQRLGAYAIPGFYLMSGGRTHALERPVRRTARSAPCIRRTVRCGPRPPSPADILRLRRHVDAPDRVRFHYADPGAWMEQFLRRPHPVRVQRLAQDSIAIVEQVGDTDRLQWLGCPPDQAIARLSTLVRASSAMQRRFFMYTLDPRLARAARRLGLTTVHGYLMVLPTQVSDGCPPDIWESLSRSAWDVQSGDRI